MENKRVTLFYDPDRDFLEVTWEPQQEGRFRETRDGRVLEKVDADGNIVGFRIVRMSTHKGPPFEVRLVSEIDG